MPFPSKFYEQFRANPANSKSIGELKPCYNNRQGKNIYTLNELCKNKNTILTITFEAKPFVSTFSLSVPTEGN